MRELPVVYCAVLHEVRHAVRQRQRGLHEVEELWYEGFLFDSNPLLPYRQMDLIG